jgi:hypothetical protein
MPSLFVRFGGGLCNLVVKVVSMKWLKSFWKYLITPGNVPRVVISPSADSQPPRSSAQWDRTAPSSVARARRWPTRSEEIVSNFTPRAHQVLALSRKEADRFNHNFVGTEHLLLGIIALGQGVAVNVLQKMGLDLENVRCEIEKHVGAGPEQKAIGNIPYTPRVKKVLALAAKESRALNHTYVGTEHILLGLLREGDGVAARVLKKLDVDIEKTRAEILREIDPNFASSAEATSSDTESVSADVTPAAENVATNTWTEIKLPARPITMTNKPLREPLDLAVRYDVYCVDRNDTKVVYRNVLFKSVKTLFQRHEHDSLSDFVELEREDGQTVFVAKPTVVRFCKHGVNVEGEEG